MKAIVVGGSRGIGKGVAEVLAQEGCEVAICSRSITHLQKAAAEIETHAGKKPFFAVADVGRSVPLAWRGT